VEKCYRCEENVPQGQTEGNMTRRKHERFPRKEAGREQRRKAVGKEQRIKTKKGTRKAVVCRRLDKKRKKTHALPD